MAKQIPTSDMSFSKLFIKKMSSNNLAVVVVLRGGLVGFEIVWSMTAEFFYET